MACSYNTGDIVYIPFWVVLEYWDVTPPTPFIKCTIIQIYEVNRTAASGEQVTAQLCDLRLKDGLIATSVQASYLIAPDQLSLWAHKIADWFIGYLGDDHLS